MARAFLIALVGVALFGIVLALIALYALQERHWSIAAGAVALTIIEAIALGVFLGSKRAIVAGVSHGLRQSRLVPSLVRVVFDRIMRLEADGEVGERGGRIVQGVERMPLAQADALLSRSVQGLTGDAQQSGWLRRTLQSQLLKLIRKYTLARFRDEAAKHGGVDLIKVRNELESTADDVICRKLQAGVLLWTAAACLGLPLLVALQTYAVAWHSPPIP